ncbi:RES family NAD+ phosphorylase [Pelagerythrobacter marensis]|uniref:RES family NAD+ phosphorylase n=1 Tax=Pelagerythrobacter marensis TaxID=543877 RepID=A0ABZ2D5E8_9SPHN
MDAETCLTDRFPPVPTEELVRLIAEFDAADEDARAATIAHLVAHHPIIAHDWGQAARYRRARVLDPGDSVDTVEELIWRKGQRQAPGRANPEGFAVLYLADRRDTALSEVRADDDDVVLSDFSIRPGQSVQVAPIGEWIQAYRTGTAFLAPQDALKLTDSLAACPPQEARAILMADAFLLDCLTSRDDDYVTSSQVALALFGRHPTIDAIAYPSRRHLGGVCFAVRTERVWKKWGLFSARRSRARHLAMGMYDLDRVLHVSGVTPEGRLHWSAEHDPRPNTAVQLDPLWIPHGEESEG